MTQPTQTSLGRQWRRSIPFCEPNLPEKICPNDCHRNVARPSIERCKQGVERCQALRAVQSMCLAECPYDGVLEANTVIVGGPLCSQRRRHRRKGVPQLIERHERRTVQQGVIRYRPLVDPAKTEHLVASFWSSNPTALRSKSRCPSPSVSSSIFEPAVGLGITGESKAVKRQIGKLGCASQCRDQVGATRFVGEGDLSDHVVKDPSPGVLVELIRSARTPGRHMLLPRSCIRHPLHPPCTAQPVMLKTGFVQRVRRVARREGSRRRAGPRVGRDGAALSQRTRR